MHSKHESEVSTGRRFAFGRNWARYLQSVDEDRIKLAIESICDSLHLKTLHGRRFLDVGSGSGLFSLAARRLGAVVHSFDYDPESVACTAELKERYYRNDPDWTVESGSILDETYVAALGQRDIVYSWGVLHHTGAMWQALQNVQRLVAPGGMLLIAIYNDQGRSSTYWLKIKQLYNRLPPGLRWLVLGGAAARLWGPTMFRDLMAGRPFATWRLYPRSNLRAMSPWRDLVDWVGGLPFEVAKPEEIFAFYRDRQFALVNLKTSIGIGCNEFVFQAPATDLHTHRPV